MKTYLDQLEARCTELGVTLDKVCRAEGVAATTLSRWRKGEYQCREGTAMVLSRRLDKIARSVRRALKAAS